MGFKSVTITRLQNCIESSFTARTIISLLLRFCNKEVDMGKECRQDTFMDDF